MKEKNTGVLRLVLRVLQGVLIGVGAVLPGISGGVLWVVFGVYKPVMELLSGPVANFKTRVPELLPVIPGRRRWASWAWPTCWPSSWRKYPRPIASAC